MLSVVMLRVLGAKNGLFKVLVSRMNNFEYID